MISPYTILSLLFNKSHLIILMFSHRLSQAHWLIAETSLAVVNGWVSRGGGCPFFFFLLCLMSTFPRFIQPLFLLINLLSYQVFLPLLISFLFLCSYQSSFFCIYDFQFPFLDLCLLIVSVLAKYNLFYYSSNCPKNDLFCFKRKKG